jgi:3-phytase
MQIRRTVWNLGVVGLSLIHSSSSHGGDIVTKADFLGLTTIPNASQFQITTIGGLSGITYNTSTNKYLILSDDRSQINPARIYTATIAIGDGSLGAGDVAFEGVTTIRQPDAAPFPSGSIDPEGIALATEGRLFVASEGDRNAGIDPFVRRFDQPSGIQQQDFGVPSKFLVGNPSSGVRNNSAFESLAITPDQKWIYTANEYALIQDSAVTFLTGSPSRILRFDATTGAAEAEFLYLNDPFASGLVELLALDHNHLLALERDAQLSIRLYEVDLLGATDIRGIDGLIAHGMGGIVAVQKQLIADLASFGFKPGNVEGMTFGPTLPDGRRALLLVSDDNFSPSQSSQVIALGLTLVPEPATARIMGFGLSVLLMFGVRTPTR